MTHASNSQVEFIQWYIDVTPSQKEREREREEHLRSLDILSDYKAICISSAHGKSLLWLREVI